MLSRRAPVFSQGPPSAVVTLKAGGVETDAAFEHGVPGNQLEAETVVDPLTRLANTQRMSGSTSGGRG